MAIDKKWSYEEWNNRWTYKYKSFLFYLYEMRDYYTVEVWNDKLRCVSCGNWCMELNYDLDIAAGYLSLDSAMWAVNDFIRYELKWAQKK